MEANTITLTDALDICWRRKFSVIKFLVAAVVIVGAVTILMPKTYKSDAKLFVRLGRENSSLGVTAGLGDNQVYSVPLNRESEMNSITDMIQNKELFGRVVDQIGAEVILEKKKSVSVAATEESSGPGMAGSIMSSLAEWGITNNVPLREKAIIKLQKKVNVKASEKSNVISVELESYDPKIAQDTVSAIVEDYKRLHARINRSEGSLEFLANQTDAAKLALEISENAFESFKNETNLIEVDRQRQVLVDRIASLENQWMDAEASRVATEAELSGLSKQLLTLSRSGDISAKEGWGKEAIDGMRRDLYSQETVFQELLSKLSPDHPQVQQAKEKLDASRKIFDQNAVNLVETTLGANNVYEAVKIAIMQKQPALEALQSRVNILKKQIDTVQKSLAEFNMQEKNFLRLQRDMVIQDENYKRHSRTLLHANMDTSLQESNLSNLSIFQSATFNPKPARPNKALNLAAALFLGLTGGIAWAILLEHRQRSKDRRPQLEVSLDLPVVASIPRQRARELTGTN